MRKTTAAIALLLAMTVLITGCLGGGDDKKKNNNQEFVKATGITVVEGDVETLAQAQPETVIETVDIAIPIANLTGITLDIKVMEGVGGESDEGTNPDEVSGSLDSSGENGGNESLQNGQTNYQTTVAIQAGEGQSLPSSWTLTLEVVCHASNDQWPGPMIWRGVPDHGFSYNVTVTYEYLEPKAAE
jgi:hypothetical protein